MRDSGGQRDPHTDRGESMVLPSAMTDWAEQRDPQGRGSPWGENMGLPGDIWHSSYKRTLDILLLFIFSGYSKKIQKCTFKSIKMHIVLSNIYEDHIKFNIK